MPLNDRSILEILVERLDRFGFSRVVLSVGHLAHLIKAVLKHREAQDLPVDFVYEEQPLGTAGPLKLIEGLTSTFVVMNGDVLTDLDFREVMEATERATTSSRLPLTPEQTRLTTA